MRHMEKTGTIHIRVTPELLRRMNEFAAAHTEGNTSLAARRLIWEGLVCFDPAHHHQPPTTPPENTP